MSHKIQSAKIHFNEQGTPIADNFDDVYFSNHDGLNESEYVFIEHNNLKERWKECASKRFVIAESGFGTGLNFLLTWQAFHQAIQSNQVSQLAHLHFISFEKYPLTKQDLSDALSHWPQLKEYNEKLIANYPISLPNCHRLTFEIETDECTPDIPTITLDLWFGDINDSLNKLSVPKEGLIDAWYLDGFAPDKNPEMWSQTLFDNMSKVSKKQSTFSTFTAAGFVKRGLIAAGYKPSKYKGWGKKRESLHGMLENKQAYESSASFNLRSSSSNLSHDANVAIIGGGIASALVAYYLSKQGINSTIYCKDSTLARGASKNRQGALYPLLQGKQSPISDLLSHGFLFARRLYDELIANGFHFEHDWCGVLQPAYNEKHKTKYKKLVEKQLYPQSIVHAVNRHEASTIAGVEINFDGLYFPLGGWITPSSLIDALLEAAKPHVTVVLNNQVNALTETQQTESKHCSPSNEWELSLESNPSADNTHVEQNDLFARTHTSVVITSGHLSNQFIQTKHLPFQPVRGQVSHAAASSESNKLNTVLCYNGYMTPALDNIHCVGATFGVNQTDTDIRAEDHTYNQQLLSDCFKEHNWLPVANEQSSASGSGKVGIRCMTPDHMPIVGTVHAVEEIKSKYSDIWKANKYIKYEPSHSQSNLFILSGLGARGLCSGPILASTLVNQMLGLPHFLPQDMLDALHPSRFQIKSMIKKEHL